jgi:hypothetical protein
VPARPKIAGVMTGEGLPKAAPMARFTRRTGGEKGRAVIRAASGVIGFRIAGLRAAPRALA